MSSGILRLQLRIRSAVSPVPAVLLAAALLTGSSARAQPAAPSATPTSATAPPTQEVAQAEVDDRAGPFRLHDTLRAPDWLLLGGSQRTRYETLRNQFRPGLDRNDQVIALRTLLTLGGTFGPVSIVGELQDSRGYLTDSNSGVSSIVVNPVEPLQGYVNVHLKDVFLRGAELDLRAGRQTLDLGGRRLIARNRFRNTIQNYTGLTAHWVTDRDTEVFAFAVLPVRVAPSNRERERMLENEIEIDRESFDLALWGAFFDQPLGARIALEGYVFGLHERDGEDDPSRDRQLYTSGLRLNRNPVPGAWDLDLESVLQLGTRRGSTAPEDTVDHDVLAHFHHASGGYTFDVSWAPRISAEFDYASGDDASTGRSERFDSLFGPRRAEFGPTDIYGPLGRENIISAGLRVGAEPHPLVDGYISWRANALANVGDVFARSEVVDPTGSSGAFAGNQIEVRTRVWLILETLRWELGGAALIQGPFLRDAPNASGYGSPLFGYTDLELSF